MKYSVGLDVSVKETAICIVDEAGKVVRESKVATELQAIIAFLNGAEFEYARIGLEAGPLSQWLVLLRHESNRASAYAEISGKISRSFDMSNAAPLLGFYNL